MRVLGLNPIMVEKDETLWLYWFIEGIVNHYKKCKITKTIKSKINKVLPYLYCINHTKVYILLHVT